MDKVIENLYTRYSANGVVSTDTRNIAPGSIFFALKGDKYNANEFALEALEKGANCVVIDEEKYALDDRFILVENVLAALQDLARYHRSLLQIPVIGLTGSNGKTTTKELMHAVLSRKYNTVATKGNLNNHIGVPLTLLSIDTTAEMAVIEMGANHPGEIAMLCEIADPTHGLITNIGRAHIGTFGGFENIIKAKAALYQHLISRQGVAFVNSMNPLLTGLAKPIARKVTYPSARDSYQCDLVNADPLVTIMADNGDEVQTKLIGAYNFENIACALCVGKFFGVEARLANQAVAEYDPGNMRSQIVKRNTNTIILDAYNANPSSMQAAIENMARINAKNKVLILGDMFELEDEADREHRAIGKLIREKGFENVYLCGNLFKTALHEIPYAKYFMKKGELEEELKQYPISNATVLIKASRGIGLETVVEYL
jgi:UDP-N-acetylmuramoyl-tripeptide--D-alanyl-D-alanine ligase